VRVLGVDPGLTRCGLAVVDSGSGRQVNCVAVHVVQTPAGMELSQRLMAVAEVVQGWLAEHRPEVVAVERVFSQRNVRTAMGTAQVGGVVALLAAQRGLPVAFHTPSEVKAAVTGSGRADKQQVTTMVTRLLRLPVRPSPADAADALALAICHLWRAPLLAKLAEAEQRAAGHQRAAVAARREAIARYRAAEAAASAKAASPVGSGTAATGTAATGTARRAAVPKAARQKAAAGRTARRPGTERA
jgi:crossover junction endodeoxyribonuclease RuvC